MTNEQGIGVLLIVIGLYFVICSTVYPDFFLYKLKVAQVRSIFGEKTAQRFYFGLGIVLLIAGLLKAVGMF